jgi:hypothetical protein
MKVGFIGLGNVGGKLAGSLLRNGIDLTCMTSTPIWCRGFVAARRRGGRLSGGDDAGLRRGDHLPALARGLGRRDGGDAARDGAGQDLDGDVDDRRRRDPAPRGRGCGHVAGLAVECPVSGGCHRADTGNISIFAGGPRGAVEAVMPLLKHLGRRILHTGDLGSASKLKVMTNYLATVHLVALCEALTTMKAAGLDLATTYEAIRISFRHLLRPRDRKPVDPVGVARRELHHGPRAEGHRPVPEARRRPRRAARSVAPRRRDHGRRPAPLWRSARSPTASSSGWKRRRASGSWPTASRPS